MPRTTGSADQTRRLLWLSNTLQEGDPDLSPGKVHASTLLEQYRDVFLVERKCLGRDIDELRQTWNANVTYDPPTKNWVLRGTLVPPVEYRPRIPTGTRAATVQAIARMMTASMHGGDLLGVLDEILPALQENGQPFQHATVIAPPRMVLKEQALLDRWTKLHGAIGSRHRVEFHYRSAGHENPRWLRQEPLHLLWVSGGWYLLAAMPGSPKVCQYALSRMEGEVKELREKFVKPDADRASRLEDLCAPVEGLYRSGSLSWATLSVDEDLGQILKDRLQDPDPQTPPPKQNPDGSWEWRMRFFASSEGTQDAARRILSFGPGVKVEHPPKLAQAVREIAGEIAGMYGG